MKERIIKIPVQAAIQICLTLLLLVFICAGYGQVNANVPHDSTILSDPIPEHQPAKEIQSANQNPAKPWVDPLFFIPGQLCQHLRVIHQDKKGNLWFGTNNYGLMRYNGDTLEYFTEADGFGGGRVIGIVEDKEGNVWIGAYGGLTRYDGITFTNFTEKDGLLNNELWSVLIDRNGIFWIGNNDGISRFDGKEFSSFSIPKAIVKDTTTIYSYDRITSIIEDKNGILWFGTDGFGICKYNPKAKISGTGESFTLLTKDEGLPDNTIHDLMVDSKGNIWIGTFFGGVSMYDGETFTNFTIEGVINGIEVGGFFEDSNGDIWFAAENDGVYRYDGVSFKNFSMGEGLNTNGILSIYRDREKRFWFGGWGGLFRFDGTSFFSVTRDGPWD